MINLTDEEFLLLHRYVRDKFGLNLERKRYLVESRLGAELEQGNYRSFGEYWACLLADKSGRLAARLSERLTTNYTFFYREEKHFAYLRSELLPQAKAPLALWCAGCATGQESYTLSMLLAESQDQGRLAFAYHIIATDLSAQALETAETGIYQQADYQRLPEAWRQRYCLLRPGGDFIVTTRIRDRVRHIRQNLMESRPGSNRFDMVFCRNVLIYFREQERAVVVRNLFAALRPGGSLFIGQAESLLGCEMGFEYIKPALYRKPGAAGY